MTTRTTNQRRMDKIVASCGCAIEPTICRRGALVVLPQCQGQGERDSDRLARCRAALVAAGIAPPRLGY